MDNAIINNAKDLLDEVGVETEALLSKCIYKSTDCGISVHFDDDYVTIETAVEGANAEFGERIPFPFSAEYFWTCLEDMDQEASACWLENNEEW